MVGLFLALAGCGGEARLERIGTPETAEDAFSPPGIETQATPAAPGIGEVIWTTASDPAMAPAEPVDHYATDAARLIAAVPASNIGPGSYVDAAWTYNDTPLESFATRLTVDSAFPERWLSFHLERSPDIPWPAGTYEVTISVDGAALRSASIEVRAPE